MSSKLGSRWASKSAQSWWHRATDEQRLAQIDAGIELGMTRRQVAFAVGLGDTRDGSSVSGFASANGRKFPAENRGNSGRAKKRVGDLKRAYFGGYERDFSDTVKHDDHSGELVLE